MDASRKGKIASLPSQIREEVNRRLFEGQQAPQIIPWLHEQPEVLRVLDDKWGEEPISPQNLSQWRKGGFADWLARNDRVHAIRTLSDYSLRLAQAAGGSISEGAAAIAGGRILELLEKSAEVYDPKTDKFKETGEPALTSSNFELGDLIASLVSLRKAEIGQQKVNQNTIVLGQRDRQLALEEKRFEARHFEIWERFYDDKRAKEIMESDVPRPIKMGQMIELMFGEKPA